MADIVEELQRLRRTIEETKQRKARKEGEYQAAMATLKAEFDVDSIEAAQALLLEYDKENAQREKSIEGMFNKLKEEYDW